jgi:hypothetical protein
VPTAVVFVLDESGSMATDDRFQSSRAAAIAVAELLVPGADKAALITFSDDAHVAVSLTTETDDVIDAVRDLPHPEGLTNMAAAFDTALDELEGDDTPNKIIIFFTDGYPEPLGIDQANQIVGPLTEEAKDMGVQVFPVTLAAEQFWLGDVAEETFGTYTNTEDVNELTALFEAAFAEVSHVLTTRNLVITEVLSPELAYIRGSLNYSFSGPGETEEFAAGVEENEAEFGATNSIMFPVIAILPQDRIFTFTFQATSHDCLTPTSEELEVTLDIDDIMLSAVQYTTGGDAIYSVAIPQEQIVCKRPGDVIVHKTFDEINLVVRLTLTNAYQDRSITDIEVFEAVTDNFEPLLLSANPPLDGQSIVTSSTPHRRFLYWRVEELAPLESREFSFEVRVLACSPETSPPLAVNLVIPPLLEAISCMRGTHINYVVPTGIEEPFQLESKIITYLQEPRLSVMTSGVFELPPCPTVPGSLAGTIGSGVGGQCPEDVLDTSNIACPICEALHDSLFTVDPEGTVLPKLVRDFEVSKDQKEFTIELRQGVSFHDGTLLNSQAVAYNFGNAIELFPGIIRPSLVKIGRLEFVKTLDDFIVHFRLKQLDSRFLELLTGLPGMIASSKAPKGIPVGVGPFQFAELHPHERAVLKRFEGYWNGSPLIRGLVYLAIADEVERYEALLAGKLDIMVGQKPSVFTQAQQSRDCTVIGSSTNFRAVSRRVKNLEFVPNGVIKLHRVKGPDPLRVGLPRSWYIGALWE